MPFTADDFDQQFEEAIDLIGSDAMAEIERCSGTQFDPGIVTALVEDLACAELSSDVAAPALAS